MVRYYLTSIEAGEGTVRQQVVDTDFYSLSNLSPVKHSVPSRIPDIESSDDILSEAIQMVGI